MPSRIRAGSTGNLTDAQEARRILDRLVGYKISPLLWKRVQPGLSAGRVQSVAVRLIVEREREIDAFIPGRVLEHRRPAHPRGPGAAVRRPAGPGARRQARRRAPTRRDSCSGREGEADDPRRARSAGARYRVTGVEKKQRKRSPSPPFTTSTLQQEAARKLGFGARRTMQIAQRLYEGIDLPGEGSVGLITYMRTDSVTIADSALREIAETRQVRVRRGVHDRGGAPVQDAQPQRPGGARGDPADERDAHAAAPGDACSTATSSGSTR